MITTFLIAMFIAYLSGYHHHKIKQVIVKKKSQNRDGIKGG